MWITPELEQYVETFCVNPDQGAPLGFADYEYLLVPLSDESPRVVIQKAAQVGATVLAILRALYQVDARQAHSMYLFPTHRSAARFSRGRFSVMLERSDHLRGLFREVKNAGHMRAGVANFYCHGARSRTELMSTPVGYLTLDERDELYLGNPTGRQPWSAVELARQRLSGQRDGRELNLSTPTIPGHGIAAEFAQSDQHHYHLLCPHCERLVLPSWPEAIDCGLRIADCGLKDTDCGLRISGCGLEDKGVIARDHSIADGLPQSAIRNPKSAMFRCPACRRPWTDDQRREAIRAGKWIPLQPGRALRGYHLSQLTSPAASAGRIMSQWLACQDNPAAKQVFYNAVLGLPYLAEGMRLERRFVAEAIARGGYPMAASSQGSVMGVDVGPTWCHVVIAEYPPVVPPSQGGTKPVLPSQWGTEAPALRLVWIGKAYDWPQVGELIRRYRVQSYVIDAMPETHLVRNLLRDWPLGFMCYYQAAQAGGSLHLDAETRTLKAPRTESLDAMYLRWRTGNVAAPSDLPLEFVEQLTALVRVVRVRRDGQACAEYVEGGGPDHYAHAMNYCELAALLRGKPLRFEVTLPGETGAVAW